jgi:uncharacterized protein (DUF1015 family)
MSKRLELFVADVKPFACCRPVPALAAEVASLPYDVFSRDEAAAYIASNHNTFLRIDKSTALFPPEVDEYDARVYVKAAELLASDEQAGIYLHEAGEHYFLYRLEKDGHAQTGVVACIAVADYEADVLRRHENTRAFKLEDRVRHIEALGAQTGPVLVTYRARAAIDAAVEQVTATTAPLYDFIAADGVRHTAWRVDDAATEDALRAGFAGLDALYIADGHHRAAAAATIGAKRHKDKELHGTFGKVQGGRHNEAGHFLIVAFPSNQLEILDYNRVVFDTNGLSPEELLLQIAKSFEVEPCGVKPYRPQRKGEFALYLAGAWYRLAVHERLRPPDPVEGLDVSLLQNLLLAPILGIDDPRSSKRIAYVGGVRGLDELKRRADACGDGVAFALYPCSLDELFAVADAGRLMPPKSTWFEPKPRSGLFIHRI